MKQKFILLIIFPLLFISCSQKKPILNGQSNKTSLFNSIDKDKNQKIFLNEYIDYIELENKKERESTNIQTMYHCDKNNDKQIGFYEVKETHKLIHKDEISSAYIISACPIVQQNFHIYDSDNDKIITEKELNSKFQHYSYNPTMEEMKERETYSLKEAKAKIKQCDSNADNQLNPKEASGLQCQIPEDIFHVIDGNKDKFIRFDEIKNIPTKYATLRNSYYRQNEDDKIKNLISSVTALSPMAILECDTNKNHKLSEKEATTLSCGFTHKDFIKSDLTKDGVFSKKDIDYYYHRESFDRLDINQDKYLDINEIIRML
ncbi:MAG: Unknown protein [uncultured Sulfurovum sp.]|uniref:EF-hand domain-containing protein n=1 Tax=uncultured Sulfurovum sp. TaxID=269237 RepID=A0A6S6TE80_9BACT|nr:MAG: Unknown protein [uncultured Sulfurovum sp.]